MAKLRKNMTDIKQALRLHHELHKPITGIELTLTMSKNTMKVYKQRFRV